MQALTLQDENESWKAVTGYEGHYEVSDHGRIRSVSRIIETSQGPQRFKGKVLSRRYNTSGYHQVVLTKDSRSKSFLVHRLVLQEFIGPCPDGMEACHFDDNSKNNHVKNLRWDTSAQNKQDLNRNGKNYYLNRTHCRYGHEFLEENICSWAKRKGTRACLACHRARAREQKHPELRSHHQELSDSYYLVIVGGQK